MFSVNNQLRRGNEQRADKNHPKWDFFGGGGGNLGNVLVAL
jgi:hypothetical protein